MKNYFMIFFISLFLISNVTAMSDIPDVVRIYGQIKNSNNDMANCNLLSNPTILINSNDVTYASTVGFYDKICYYSIDILKSDISKDDILVIEIENTKSQNFTYNDDTIVEQNIIVDMDSIFFNFQKGCMDEDAYNYEESTNFDDGSCLYGGCMNQEAYNYDSSATIDDGSCMYVGCTDENAQNYDFKADINDGCIYSNEEINSPAEIIYGCIEKIATNYNSKATDDDGSCIFLNTNTVETKQEDTKKEEIRNNIIKIRNEEIITIKSSEKKIEFQNETQKNENVVKNETKLISPKRLNKEISYEKISKNNLFENSSYYIIFLIFANIIFSTVVFISLVKLILRK